MAGISSICSKFFFFSSPLVYESYTQISTQMYTHKNPDSYGVNVTMQLCFYRCVFVTFLHLNTKHRKPSDQCDSRILLQNQSKAKSRALFIYMYKRTCSKKVYPINVNETKTHKTGVTFSQIRISSHTQTHTHTEEGRKKTNTFCMHPFPNHVIL